MYNFHTHTKRCGHAKGEDEEYVLHAIENGYTTLGFSDHAPYIFPNKYESTFRIKSTKSAQDYADSIRALQGKYNDRIKIKLGFELEYYPELHDEEMEYLSQFDYDYLILGQHFTDNEYEPYARYAGHPTDSPVVLDKYISQVIMGARTGMFSYVAHPDVINFTGDKKIYTKKMTHLAEKLNELDIPVEFNFLGFSTGRHYPNRDFWKIVSEVGNKVIIGLDAHEPDVFDNKKDLRKAHRYLNEFGIAPLEKFDIKKINQD